MCLMVCFINNQLHCEAAQNNYFGNLQWVFPGFLCVCSFNKWMESTGCRLISYITWNGKSKYLNTFFLHSVTAASDTPFCPLLKCAFATTYSSTHILAALLPSLYCLMNKVSLLSLLLWENTSLQNIILWLYLSDIEQISCIIGDQKVTSSFRREYFLLSASSYVTII